MLKMILLLCLTSVWAVETGAKFSDMAATLVAETPEGLIVAVDRIDYPLGVESVDGARVTERVTAALTRFPNVTVVERNKLERVMAELKLQRSGAVAEDSTQELGKLTGANFVVVGSIGEADQDQWLLVDLRLVNVESGDIVRSAAGKIRRNWRIPKPAQARPDRDSEPISLGQLTKRKNINPSKALLIGEGCGYNIYYEGDGSFMRWSRRYPHGEGGYGAYIKREDSKYCDFVSYIEQLVRYKHPELQDVWRDYRRENRI